MLTIRIAIFLIKGLDLYGKLSLPFDMKIYALAPFVIFIIITSRDIQDFPLTQLGIITLDSLVSLIEVLAIVDIFIILFYRHFSLLYDINAYF